jgi:hypothetical protein
VLLLGTPSGFMIHAVKAGSLDTILRHLVCRVSTLRAFILLSHRVALGPFARGFSNRILYDFLVSLYPCCTFGLP